MMRQKYVYKPFVVSPLRLSSAQALRLGSGQASAGLRTGLSNHGRNVLKTLTLRLAQGERNL